MSSNKCIGILLAYSIYVLEFNTRLFSLCNATTLKAIWVDIDLVAADTVMICVSMKKDFLMNHNLK